MNELRVFKNDELDLKLRTILNDDGRISVNAEDTAIGFGWYKIESKNGKAYTSIRWQRMINFAKDFGFDHSWSKDTYIPESLYYLLAMKANNDRAKKFQVWLAMEVLPAIRKTGTYTKPELDREQRLILRDLTIDDYTNAAGVISHCVDETTRQIVIGLFKHVGIVFGDVPETVSEETFVVKGFLPEPEKLAARKYGPYTPWFDNDAFDEYLNLHQINNTFFARVIGCHNQAVSKWRRDTSPTRHYRDKICDALNVPHDYFNMEV